MANDRLLKVRSTNPQRVADHFTFKEITAMSVVPPPISTIMLAEGCDISKPHPIAAAIVLKLNRLLAPALNVASNTARFSTSVTPEGTHNDPRLKQLPASNCFMDKIFDNTFS